MKRTVLAAAALLVCLITPALDAQLSTGLANVVTDVPLLDDEPDPFFEPLTALPVDADGAFELRPGAFEADLQSFCLLAGTHAPSRGDGYLYGPLAGASAGVIEAILDRAPRHPGIPQQQIQQLLWAILAQTKFSALQTDLKIAASTLLTPRELADLEGLSARGIGNRLRGELIARAPAAQRILEANERLRELLTDAAATYEQMESVAVLPGRPARQRGDREIPETRWSYHPDGYFIRFRPEHYTRTRVQLIVPRGVTPSLRRDDKGRVVRALYPEGLVVEAEYDDTIRPLDVPGDPGLKGYAFKRLRFAANGESAEILNDGWAFSGRSNGRGDETRLPDMNGRMRRAPGPSDQDDSGWWERYKGAKERYGKLKALQKDAEARRAREERDRRGPSERDVDDATDEGHYRDGYDKAKGGDLGEKLKWIQDQKRRERNLAEYIHCRLTGGCDPADEPKKKEPPRRKYRPGRGAAVPGAQGSQRLGLTARRL